MFDADAKVHCHLTCYVSLCDGPRLVLLSFGLVASTCLIYFWPRLVLLVVGPDLYYLLLAPTCFIFCWPRLVLSAFGPDLFYFPAVFEASW